MCKRHIIRVREFEQLLKDHDIMTPSGVANFLIKLSKYLHHICQNSNLMTGRSKSRLSDKTYRIVYCINVPNVFLVKVVGSGLCVLKMNLAMSNELQPDIPYAIGS